MDVFARIFFSMLEGVTTNRRQLNLSERGNVRNSLVGYSELQSQGRSFFFLALLGYVIHEWCALFRCCLAAFKGFWV